VTDRRDVATAFRAGLAAATQAAFSDELVVDVLIALHARGAEAWPEVELAPARFAAALARRLDATSTQDVLALLHHDVYLAIACADNDPVAIAACDRHCARELEFAARRLRATTTELEDARSELRRLLFTSDDERTAAVVSFTGRGDLRGYARVIAARLLARRRQRQRSEITLEDEMLDAVTPALDPEVAFLREQYRADVDAAFRVAIASLSERSRAVLRYHLLDGWTIDQIGAEYRVHRATAARWLTSAREDLGARIRAELCERLAIPLSQVDSIIALVTSRIEISLERLLAPE
jgi:RNA polymerase sigma-70 factor, ECF subfamily